ncbi:MAG TPA: hypothetical protein VFL45_07470 [Gammaproteobacteria bacterium]|nr:hypothetical protein [Gammaproteobacteria bacterium]HET7587898.1 hypothetical protein [Gammaproteobacteria bacterium]
MPVSDRVFAAPFASDIASWSPVLPVVLTLLFADWKGREMVYQRRVGIADDQDVMH